MALLSKYPWLRRFSWEVLYNTFLSLEPKQQQYALAGVGAAVLLIVATPLWIAHSKLSGLEEKLAEGREQEREIVRVLGQYQQLAATLKGMEQEISKGFDATITTTVATLAGESQIKERIQNIRDRGATSMELFDKMSVEVQLTKVTVPQLMDYLYKIEHHPQLLLRIMPLRIKRRFDNPQLLDVTFEAATYRLQGVGG